MGHFYIMGSAIISHFNMPESIIYLITKASDWYGCNLESFKNTDRTEEFDFNPDFCIISVNDQYYSSEYRYSNTYVLYNGNTVSDIRSKYATSLSLSFTLSENALRYACSGTYSGSREAVSVLAIKV